MNKTPDAILFDLDGVLIDSEGLYTAFWDKTEKLFPTGIPDFARYIKGTNLDSIMKLFKPEERDEIMSRILDFDSNLVYPVFEGAEEMLALLAERNIPAALVTSSNPEKMEQLFRQYPHFRNHFATIVNGSMVSRGKPDPEGYLLAAERLGVKPERCVVVEDSLQGIRAGRAAGCEVWGLYTTLPRTVVEPEATFVFANISEALEQLRS
ncbi:MAG: HAD family phosphatase [Muribaculaceae bacterium]|nr:HAD family phosphatase [Muribaculaceae bacterium]